MSRDVKGLFASAIVALVFLGCPSTDSLVNGTREPSTLPDGGTSSSPDAAPGVCGDGKRTGNEPCEGKDLGSATCAQAVALGWEGPVSCTSKCTLDDKACVIPETTYNTMDVGEWTTFDLTNISSDTTGFRGAAFDGKYIYFAPYGSNLASGLIARYNPAGGFASKDQKVWTNFDLTTVDPAAKGYQGAAFDGRFVYFVPTNEGGAPHGIVARFDSTQDIGTRSAWKTFHVAAEDSNSKGFTGAVFDGRYLYLVPGKLGSASHGTVVQFDTQSGDEGFTQATNWKRFDLGAELGGAVRGFAGGTFDGRYVYLVPHENNETPHGVVARYDTQTNELRSRNSWETVDVASFNAGSVGFYGALFDGTYVYLVPSLSAGSILTRYDPSKPFADAAAWSTFDLKSADAKAAGYRSGVFDGRFLYLVPYNPTTGVVMRYDTTQAMDATASWSSFDTTSLNPNARGFIGAGFDGRYLYFVPMSTSIAVRFEAKNRAWLPRLWKSSFL